MARLIDQGVSPEDLWQAVVSMKLELVFTAHPTEVSRRTLLKSPFGLQGCYAVYTETRLEHSLE